MAKKDYYEALGVSKSATEAEIKSAFRKKAKEFHPDLNKNDDASVKFKEVQEAYEVLSDSTKRKQYDQYGHAAFDQNGGSNSGFGGYGDFGGMSDIFESMFSSGGFGFDFGGKQNRKARGDDRLVRMNLSFEEAIYGISKSFNIEVTEDCPHCDGVGGFGAKTCSTCSGSGYVNEQKNTLFGSFVTKSVCHVCGGTGHSFDKKCNICSGVGKVRVNKEIKIDIPAGVDTGNQMRIPNKGEMGHNGGPSGDLYVEFKVASHPFFERENDDIYIEVPVTISEAVLGVKKDIPTLYGSVSLNIPAGTTDGVKHRLKEKGIKNDAKKHVGDMYAIIRIIVPEKLSKKEKVLFEELSKNSNHEHKKFKEFEKYLKQAKK